MSNLERQALQETKKPTDGGFGILDAFQGCFEDTLREFRKVQCEFLNAKPAEAVLPPAEISRDGGGEYIAFSAADKGKEKTTNLDQWLDGKTRLKPQAA